MPPHPLLRVPPEDEAHIRAGLDEAERGEGIAVTMEQLHHWAATGKWPWETAAPSTLAAGPKTTT